MLLNFTIAVIPTFHCHSHESGNPVEFLWIPVFMAKATTFVAGMTLFSVYISNFSLLTNRIYE